MTGCRHPALRGDAHIGPVRHRSRSAISRVGKPPEDQIHLAHAAMPGAEEQLAPPRIQSLARPRRAGHRNSSCAAHIAWMAGGVILATGRTASNIRRVAILADNTRLCPGGHLPDRREIGRHATLPPRSAVRADHLAGGRRAEGRRADREGRAGRPRRPRGARRRPAVHAAAFGDRPPQPAGHRARGRGRDRHAGGPDRPPPAAAARQPLGALPGLCA